MFSNTLLINHGQQLESVRVTSNGLQHAEQRREETERVFSQSGASYYTSHLLMEQQHHDGVSCFVRSEIEWVFLKNVKV